MRVTPITASHFLADGGAMFGLVPKPIWSHLIPPNADNAIPQNANCLLVELGDGRRGLIDTGCGDPSALSEKERIRKGLGDSWELMEVFSNRGLDPAAIDFVVLTHLHWDHVGGMSYRDKDELPCLTFPNAEHFVHGIEWDDAFSTNPLLGQSYSQPSLEALGAARNEKVLLVTDAVPDILPGIRMARSGGHTEGHCVVVLSDDNLEIDHPDADRLNGVTTLVFAADVCPTQAHLRLVFQTAYDTYPLDTRAWKLDVLPEIEAQGYGLMFDHDPELFGATLAPDPKAGYQVDRVLQVNGDS